MKILQINNLIFKTLACGNIASDGGSGGGGVCYRDGRCITRVECSYNGGNALRWECESGSDGFGQDGKCGCSNSSSPRPLRDCDCESLGGQWIQISEEGSCAWDGGACQPGDDGLTCQCQGGVGTCGGGRCNCSWVR